MYIVNGKSGACGYASLLFASVATLSRSSAMGGVVLSVKDVLEILRNRLMHSTRCPPDGYSATVLAEVAFLFKR